jgi:ribosomal protein S18 acetylase RimI-like enzyme
LPITVRAAVPADAAAIAAFNRAMARETEGKDLDPERLAAGVAAVFADPSRGGYRVAERDGAVVGCLMVTYEWSDWRNGTFWWIQSVYVEPEARRTGVFRALYGDVLRAARATEGVCGVRLYVERENRAAQAVYDAVGMTRSGYRFYEVDFVLGR